MAIPVSRDMARLLIKLGLDLSDDARLHNKNYCRGKRRGLEQEQNKSNKKPKGTDVLYGLEF